MLHPTCFAVQAGYTPLTPLTVDCANGVGAPALSAFLTHLSATTLITPTKAATTTPGALNSECGADYVKTKQRAPPGVELVPGQRYASFDGDADRIVYYYATDSGEFRLLDGDKIAGLCAGFIMEMVRKEGLELEVGVVQTAYANGASTEYLTNVLVSNVSLRHPVSHTQTKIPFPFCRTSLSRAPKPASSTCTTPRSSTTSASTLRPTGTAPSSSPPRPCRRSPSPPRRCSRRSWT